MGDAIALKYDGEVVGVVGNVNGPSYGVFWCPIVVECGPAEIKWTAAAVLIENNVKFGGNMLPILVI